MVVVARATCNTPALYSFIFRFYLLLCFSLYVIWLAAGMDNGTQRYTINAQ